MGVVIGEFEVLSESRPEQHPAAAEAEPKRSGQEKIEPCAVASALRSLQEQALRAWAH
jgi:hypothetical protein